ncbi:MAG TPA: deoxyribonuclease IV [bacterium]|nr:deoxyribonuclease IV [bacterium]
MLFGTHISAAGGVDKAPLNAHKFLCECYQFFSRSPQGGKAPELTTEVIQKFKANNKKYNFKDFYIHAPYYINLASLDNKIYYGSVGVLKEELERGSVLGAQYLMTHLGSAKEMETTLAIKKVAQGIEKILTGYGGKTEFLIEISAGAGKIMGDSFEEIKLILDNINLAASKKIGICFDTAHAFASGYDLRDKKAVSQVLNLFDKTIGLKKLKLIHLNDSKAGLSSHTDRHAHLGDGQIGLAGFKALIEDKRLQKINYILETPTEAGMLKDIMWLKKMRDA